MLVNDFTLNQLLELRPATIEELQLVSGFGQEALRHFSQPLLQVELNPCSAAAHLHAL